MWMIAQAFLRHKHLRKLATRESVGAHRFVRQQSGGDHLAQEARLPASWMSSKRKTRSWPQAVAREMSTMKFKKGRLMGAASQESAA